MVLYKFDFSGDVATYNKVISLTFVSQIVSAI